MLPAHPPYSRRSVGTRNETLRMCSCSGRICCAKCPGKVVMVSKANEPQINADMGAPRQQANGPRRLAGSRIENLDGVPGDLKVTRTQQRLQHDVAARLQHG